MTRSRLSGVISTRLNETVARLHTYVMINKWACPSTPEVVYLVTSSTHDLVGRFWREISDGIYRFTEHVELITEFMAAEIYGWKPEIELNSVESLQIQCVACCIRKNVR